MHWVLQNNIFKEDAYDQLIETLDRFGLPYSIHKVVPFVGELHPEPELDHKNVICMGSYSMRHHAKKMIWTPGVFDLEPCDFEMQRTYWGQHMLNFHSKISRFEDAQFPEGSDLAFIRPVSDSKVFAGKVFERDEFYTWKVKVCVLEFDYGTTMSKDTLIQVAEPLQIHAEYRFWVVHGDIITASLYKQGETIRYSQLVDERFHDFVRDRIAEWQPHAAFVIDVADTPNGIKVVEINTLNSSGFYAADMQKLVMALEEGFSR